MAGRVMAVTQRHRDNMGRRGWHVFFLGGRAFGIPMVGSNGTKGLVHGSVLQERLSQLLSSCEVVSRGILYKAVWLLTADMFGFKLWEKK